MKDKREMTSAPVKKILIATGGTGGHIYPALVTAEELRRRGCEVRFIGALGMAQERILSSGFVCEILEVRGFVAKRPTEMLLAVFFLCGAFFRSLGAILSYRPQVVVGFGSYSSFPPLGAAIALGRQTVIHEQNVEPGLANRLVSRFVSRVCVGFNESKAVFPRGKTVWTGTPQRPVNQGMDRAVAARKFGLDPAKETVLVFGGSQGARRINEIFLDMYAGLPPEKRFQVIHATGKQEYAVCEARYAALNAGVCVRPFIDNIDEAYAAADAVVARAGAGTVTELGMLGLPAVLIPYPGANNHQRANACVLERAGMVAIIEEKALSSPLLEDKIFTALQRKSSRSYFQEMLRNEFITDPARRLADEVECLAA